MSSVFMSQRVNSKSRHLAMIFGVLATKRIAVNTNSSGNIKMKRMFGLAITITLSFCELASGSETQRPDRLVGDSVPDIRTDKAFTREQAKMYHQQFEPSFSNWSVGGDYTRFVYLNMSEFFLQSVLNNREPVRDLPVDAEGNISSLTIAVDDGEVRLADYVKNSPTDGVIIVHRGRIVFEDYPRMDPGDLHIWFSVSKTVVSTAVAILEDRGLIDSHQPIELYLPDLKGTAWAGIPVLDILDMASGIDCPEVRSSKESCFWDVYDALGWPQASRAQANPWQTYQAMRKLRPPGEVFDYTSVNTEVLNRLVSVVSGVRYADFIEKEIWQKLGAQSNGLIASTPNSEAFSAGGVSSTLRDLARFGMLFTPSGRIGKEPVISDSLLSKIRDHGRAYLTDGNLVIRGFLGPDSFLHNSYQWDVVTPEGDFYKRGVGGQGLYISPAQDLVIAWFATQAETGEITQMHRVARQVAKSEALDD